MLLACLTVLVACQSVTTTPSLESPIAQEGGSEPKPIATALPERLVVDQSAERSQEVYNWPALGFNSVSEELKPSCLDNVLLSSAVGQRQMDLSFSMAESREELANLLNVNGRVGFNWGFLKGSGSLNYVNGKSADNYSLYLVIKATLNTQTLSVVDADLSEEAELKASSGGYAALVDSCGDQFVSSVTLGGSYYAVFRIVASSFDQLKAFKAAIRIKILFVHITIHIHRVMSDIHRHSKEMSFTVMQSPELIPSLKSGDFSLVTDTASFISEAEDYLAKLESFCQVRLVNGRYDYPSECVSSVSLQDYLTLSPDLENDTQDKRVEALLVKEELKRLLGLASQLENDLFFVISQPYLFQVSNDPNLLRAFVTQHDEVKQLQAEFYADLDRCAAHLAAVLQASCSRYLDSSAGSYVAGLKSKFKLYKDAIPVKQDNPRLPRTCQEVAEFGVLETYTETTLYYLGDATMPFKVVCIPSLKNSLVFEEYLNVVAEVDFVYELISAAEANTLDISANVSRYKHGGAFQQTHRTRYRLDPLKMTLLVDESRFKTISGFAGATEFDLDYSQGLPAASLYACSKTQPEDPLKLFSVLSLAGTDLVIDPLSLESALWTENYIDTSGNTIMPAGKLNKMIDSSGQYFGIWASLERGECLSASPKEIRLLPRSAIVSYASLVN